MTIALRTQQMAFSIPRFSTFPTISPNISKNSSSIPLNFIHFPQFNKRKTDFGCRGILRCYAAAKQQKGGAATTTKKKKKPRTKNTGNRLIGDGFVIEKSGGGGGGGEVELLESPSQSAESPYMELESADMEFESPDMELESLDMELPLPKPPAGFVLDEQGNVLMASNKRIATIIDSTDNLPLDCVIRRVFKNSRGDECMLLCPLDIPVQILKSINVEGWAAVSDEEAEAIIPAADFALAKVHMHLVHSGYVYTARGGFCYTEEDIFDIHTDTGGMPTEVIEITCFHVDGSHYMIYTPSDPLLFVAKKDKDGILRIANDELLEDPAVISAIDEETEFNALVEEEEALLDSVFGKR